MSDNAMRHTTAQVLVEYRRELIEGGFTSEEAFVMARDAASEIVHSEALAVRFDREVSA